MTTSATQEFLKPIPSSSGIYFDYIGKAKIINGHLSILIPLDISYIKPHIQNINSVLDKTKYVCEQIKPIDNSECYNILQPFTIRFMDIIKEYSSISHLVENRIKRGAWIGGIGTVMKQIFGTLDENDAVKYNNAIEHVQNGQMRLASLMKEHILVTKYTLSAYNETLHKVKINEANLNLAIDKLSANLKNVTDTANLLLINAEVNTLFTILESSLLTLSFQLEDITSSILFSNANTIHPSIITPHQLYQELADNYRHLPNSLELAVNLDLSLIHVLINVSKLVSYYVKDRIMFVLQVPLVSPRQFYLYNNIPLPVPHNSSESDSFSVIIPKHKYVVITKDKLHYGNLDSLEKCKSTNSPNYICKIASVFPSSENPSCESELLSKVVTKLPEQCKTEFIRGKLDIWKSLHNNKWIFVQSIASKLSIDCVNTEVKEINVLGTGIIEIPIFCKGYCKNTQLLPQFNVLNISLPSTLLDFNLINDSCCNIVKFNQIANNVPSIHLENLNLEEINFSKNTNEQMISDLNKIIQEPHIIKYGAHYSVLTLTVILIIGFLVGFMYYKNKINNGPGNSHEQGHLVIPLVNLPSPSQPENLERKSADKSPRLKEKTLAKTRINI